MTIIEMRDSFDLAPLFGHIECVPVWQECPPEPVVNPAEVRRIEVTAELAELPCDWCLAPLGGAAVPYEKYEARA